MKTSKGIKERMDYIIRNHSDYDTKGKKSIDLREYNFLKNCYLYLETNPSENFIKKQLNDTVRLRKIIDDRFPDWLENQTASSLSGVDNYHSYYLKLMNSRDLDEKIKTLTFLLESN